MVIISENVQNLLKSLVEQYVDFRTKGEYGISAFWYWYYQIMNHIMNLDNIDLKNGCNNIHKIPRWGKIEYHKVSVVDSEIVYVENFLYSKTNFLNWLNHKTFKRNKSYSICDTCFGFSSVLFDNSQKYGIIKSNGSKLVNPNDIINFHHSSQDFNTIRAIGFIGDRVYSIELNGEVTLLHLSKTDYLNGLTEQKRTKHIIRKRYINRIVSEVINEMLYNEKSLLN